MNVGIIFDLDGTLWDATGQMAEAWTMYLREQGVDVTLTKEMLEKEMGKVINDIADDLIPFVEAPRRYELLKTCGIIQDPYLLKHSGILYDDVEATFKTLSEKYGLYIVSNCHKGYINTFLTVTGLRKYILDIEEYGNTGMTKDKNIKLVVERNGIDMPFYVGDTVGDMDASDKAGVTFIHAAYGFGIVPPDRYKIDKFSDLPEFIEKMIKE